MIKAIVFDYDDTLVDTFSIGLMINIELGKQQNKNLEKIKEIYTNTYGKSWVDVAGDLFPELTFEEYYSKIRENGYDNLLFPMKEHTTKIIDFFYSKKIVLGILTNDIRQPFFKRTKNAKFPIYKFETSLIFCADDVEHPKPDPRAFDSIIKELEKNNIKKEEMVFCGDLITDYMAAKDAEVKFIAITSGVKTKQDFLDEGLDKKFIIGSLEELPKKIEEIK